MNKTSLTFGIVTGLVVTVSILAILPIMGDPATLTFEEYKLAEKVGSSRYLIIAVGVIMAMLNQRRKSLGAVTYRASLVVGVMTSLVCAAIVALAEGIYVALSPEVMEAAKEMMLEKMRAEGASQADINKYAQGAATMGTPLALGLWYLFETTVVGTIVAAIAGFFVKRKG